MLELLLIFSTLVHTGHSSVVLSRLDFRSQGGDSGLGACHRIVFVDKKLYSTLSIRIPGVQTCTCGIFCG